MMRYWGEIPVQAAPPSRSSFDLLQREFRQVEMQDPPLHQPSAHRPRPTTMLDIPSEPCSLTIHTVQLCQHARRLRGLLAAAQGQPPAEGAGRLEEGDILPPRPPTPAVPDDLLPLDSKAPHQPFQLRHSDPESDFYKGKGEPVTELSWPSCRQLLYQSVATVLAHAGFESAQESVLETLTDLVHEHYLRLSRLLRVAVDREARLGATPFPDVVEQVFHEVGIGSVLALQRFWQIRIKDYHSYMLQVSRELSEEYERLVNPEKAVEDSKPLKIKEEPMSDIAFPVSEEPEADLASGDQALPIGVLGAPSERLAGGLEGENSPHTSGAAGNGSPLWHLTQVKMEPQDGEEGQVSGHGVLGGDVFEEGPMSTMSEAGIPPSPSGAASDGSYASHSPDSLMGTSPVFNQRPRKRMKKV
ncbi:STAGA complex 65 subunit gamma [Megalops cyprinoides]|uniref:STAGA complex 65 subunit gamma n=1 Tax=Megalops cyprinoides TaxID=118141 RepID=UPI0018641AC5|nr:STAGA complex 65 subunit gamma [Megalops cyprinoides]XP_036398776.1 STAGA complex 65 subunit gamma [Megalops cyprinoides]